MASASAGVRLCNHSVCVFVCIFGWLTQEEAKLRIQPLFLQEDDGRELQAKPVAFTPLLEPDVCVGDKKKKKRRKIRLFSHYNSPTYTQACTRAHARTVVVLRKRRELAARTSTTMDPQRNFYSQLLFLFLFTSVNSFTNMRSLLDLNLQSTWP